MRFAKIIFLAFFFTISANVMAQSSAEWSKKIYALCENGDVQKAALVYKQHYKEANNTEAKQLLEKFHKAANQNDSKAQFFLGIINEFVEKDVKTAIEWYIKAAENGNEDAVRGLNNVRLIVNKDEFSGKYGFIDENGKVVIPFEYEYVRGFNEGLACVKKNGKYGFIDKSNKTVVPLEYEVVLEFEEGLAQVEKNGKWGFIDMRNRAVVPLEYEDVSEFKEGLSCVKKNGKFGFIDKRNRTVVPLEYEEVGFFSDGLVVVKKNGKYGYVDRNGKVAIPIVYEKAMQFGGGYGAVKKDGKWFKINKQNQLVE